MNQVEITFLGSEIFERSGRSLFFPGVVRFLSRVRG